MTQTNEIEQIEQVEIPEAKKRGRPAKEHLSVVESKPKRKKRKKEGTAVITLYADKEFIEKIDAIRKHNNPYHEPRTIWILNAMKEKFRAEMTAAKEEKSFKF